MTVWISDTDIHCFRPYCLAGDSGGYWWWYYCGDSDGGV